MKFISVFLGQVFLGFIVMYSCLILINLFLRFMEN